MKRYIICFIIAVAWEGQLAASSAALPDRWSFLPATVAEIDGQPLSRRELVEQIAAPPDELATASRTKLLQLAKIALKQQIEKYLISKLMIRDGFAPSAARIAKEYSTIFSTYSARERVRFLKKLGLADSNLKQYWQNLPQRPQEQFRLAFTLWLRRKILNSKVSDSEVEQFYRENQDKFIRPAGVKIDSINFKFKTKAEQRAAREQAENVYALLLQGVSFKHLARKYQSSGRHWQGDFIRGTLPPQLEKQIFALRDGQVSRIIALPTEFTIIRLDKKVAAGYIPLDKVKKGLKLELQRKKALTWFRQAMGRERAKLKITSYLRGT